MSQYQLGGFLLHLKMMHCALSCILLQIPPPLLNHYSLVPPGHLKKLGTEMCTHGYSRERTEETVNCSTIIASDCIPH